jgi:hypothetical protein
MLAIGVIELVKKSSTSAFGSSATPNPTEREDEKRFHKSNFYQFPDEVSTQSQILPAHSIDN